MIRKRLDPVFDDEGAIGPDDALIQTCRILDVAAQIAMEDRNLEALLGVADAYAQISRLLKGEELTQLNEHKEQEFGFTAPEVIIPKEEDV